MSYDGGTARAATVLSGRRVGIGIERLEPELGKDNIGAREPVSCGSCGQRQAVAVARAVAFASKVVLLDEPTAALGVRESAQVLELVRSLPERGMSVILISHNMEHVAQVAHRAVVLRQGRVAGSMVPTRENVPQPVSMIMGVGPWSQVKRRANCATLTVTVLRFKTVNRVMSAINLSPKKANT